MTRSKRTARIGIAGIALAVLLSAGGASAQAPRIPDNDWRRKARRLAQANGGSVYDGHFELRLGPYLPAGIDRDSGLARQGRRPFADVFGLDCERIPPVKTGRVSPSLYFGVEADYLPLRLPYLGRFGFGAGWGFTRFANRARFTKGPPTCSNEITSLTIMPMHASAVLRADEVMRRTRIPIVPYAKLGAGLAWWRIANDGGTEVICGSRADPRSCKPGETPIAAGNGLSPSLHMAAGLMLSLDFLDARLKKSLMGHGYVFGELYSDGIPLARNVLRVGATSWVAGISFDM